MARYKGLEVVAMRVAGIIAVSLLLAIVSAVPKAAAQSRYCQALQSELAELGNSRSGSAGNSNAIRKELDRARAQERRQGCRSFFSRQRSSRTCRSLRSQISSLERQLSGSRRGGFFGRSPVERRRASIRQELARSGCTRYASNNYRTICVRVCDGYYYPLSNTSSRQRFAQDAEKCMGQYRPGQAVLFYHAFPNGDAGQAVSLNGERYFEQPYAFAYRTRFMPHCAAQLQDGLSALRQRVFAAAPALLSPAPPSETPGGERPLGEQFAVAASERMAASSVTIPISRPDWSSDPETLANRAGGIVPTPVKPPEMIALVGDAMRSVGDPYYFVEATPGPPPTIAGYEPPVLKDFRVPRKASMLPTIQ